jgi:phage terminase large subunit
MSMFKMGGMHIGEDDAAFGMIRANMDLVGDCDEGLSQDAQDLQDYLFQMPDDPAATMPNRTVNITLPRKLQFLLKCHAYKVIHGGRGGGKSWAVADALLALGAAQKLRILCAREVQKSIEQSVHQLLKDRIVALGLEGFYTVQDKKITGGNGTLIVFSGLGEHTVDSIKSFEGIDIVWVEEAQSVSAKSWEILIPTIRKDKSEIWATFNPNMDTDATWKLFMLTPPDDAVVVQINWQDNKNFPDNLNKKRLHAKRSLPKEDYDNIWEGVCRTSVVGAIYAREMSQMHADKRCILVPYDPRLQVHFIWDLGWNDAMTVGAVQKPTPSTLAFINYFEDSFQRYDEVVARLRRWNYTRWGWHWLPHDGDHKNPQTGESPRILLRRLGCRVKPVMERTSPEARIKAARQVFPRVLIDSADRGASGETGFIGGARLLECLRRYSRVTPKTTNEPNTPKHDEYSHGADMFGAACEIADKIIDDDYVDHGPPVPEYDNSGNPGMGLLGG